MEIAFFVLGLIAILGTFSLYRNGQKNALINREIHRYMEEQEYQFLQTETPTTSGPFKDEFYDDQAINMYQNLGYQPEETVYRKVTFLDKAGQQQEAWMQLRIERLKATYVDWK